MKKIFKALAGVCLAGALCAGAFVVTGCGWQTETVEGEYHYVNYGVDYGVKVNVEIQTDSKGDRIRSVSIANSDYVQLSPANPEIGWTDSNRENYIANEQSLLNSYRGLYVADVLAMQVQTAANGQPSSVSDNSVVITGATQSSGRLLLAVQDALTNFGGYKVAEGEYHYPNAWSPSAPHYGIRVRVVVKGDVIAKVAVVKSNYTEVSDSWENKTIWTNGLDGLLNAYVGRTVSDVININVGVSSTTPGQPESISDSSLMITGATQGSGRLLLAVQAALKNINEEITGITDTYRGEYSYEKYGNNYGIVVNVNLTGDKIHSVNILESDYVEVTDNWDGKQLWLDGINSLLSAYEDRTVMDILTTSVTVGTDGVPSSVSDSSLMITGATQGSGRLLLAVQDALKTGGYEVYSGSYHYPNAWNAEAPHYGVAVNVIVKDEEIVGVKIADSDYVQLSPANPENGWTESNRDNYLNNESTLLNAYKGRNVVDILAMSVTVKTSGEPESVSDSSLVISGATQSSGRLLLAVQNALKAGGYEVYSGSYHYPNAWDAEAPHYGVAVNVIVKDDVIMGVRIADSDYVQLSPANPDYGWTESNRENYLNNESKLLEAYKGKSVADILAMSVTVKTSGEPESVSDSSVVISGATQSSGRLLLAVQDALKAGGYEVYSGSYHYPNAWDAEAPHYGVAVNVIVKDEVIIGVKIADSDYVQLSPANPDYGWTESNRENYLNNESTLLNAYKGKSVADILAMSVTVKDSGEPESVSDSSVVISGATQSSGRLLLAVQDALSKIA